METSTTEISSCEVCGNQDLHSVLDLGLHPLCDDLIPVGDPRQCEEYPIDVLFCSVCRTAHQRVQVSKQILFPESYHYRARFTADVLNGMAGLVDSCEQKFGKLEGRTVVDIGCNDGSLLSFFKAKGAITVGIEPTGAAEDARENGHHVFNDFITKEVTTRIVQEFGQPDIITFTNVFAHISNLDEVIDALKVLIGPKTVLVIENHYLGAVLNGVQFDTFYHEHPRTYSLTSFKKIANSMGMSILEAEFPARYGGNVRVFIGAPSAEMASMPDVDESDFEQKFRGMGASIDRWLKNKRAVLAELVKSHGPLPAKAFPGRAAILIKLLGIGEETISAVYEKPNSKKIDHYLPGTRIPILSETELFWGDTSKPIINLAWHISGEIQEYLRQNAYKGQVVDILDKNDFK